MATLFPESRVLEAAVTQLVKAALLPCRVVVPLTLFARCLSVESCSTPQRREQAFINA